MNSIRRTSVVTRERVIGIEILAEVASTIHIRCRDKDMEDDGTRDCKVGSVASREKSMWLRAICHTRERSCLVALRDGCCDNDNATFDSITFCYIGIVCDI